MKIVAAYLTQKEAKSFSRGFPNSQISLMSSKMYYKDTITDVVEKPYWCVVL